MFDLQSNRKIKLCVVLAVDSNCRKLHWAEIVFIDNTSMCLNSKSCAENTETILDTHTRLHEVIGSKLQEKL